MNGVALATQIHSNYPNCRVLLISGHPATADIIRDAEDHAQKFELLAKPFHPIDQDRGAKIRYFAARSI